MEFGAGGEGSCIIALEVIVVGEDGVGTLSVALEGCGELPPEFFGLRLDVRFDVGPDVL